MCEAFHRQLLRLAIAQICQSMGWDCVHKSTHEVLTNILQKYLEEIAKTTKEYSELFCRTEPTLDDLGSAFSDLGVLLHELEDYVSQVDPNPFGRAVAHVPIQKGQQLNHPNKEEIVNRPEVYYDYLPLFIEPKEEKPEEPMDTEDGSVPVVEEVKPETPVLLSPVRQDIRAVKRSRESTSPVLSETKRIKLERGDQPVIKTETPEVVKAPVKPPQGLWSPVPERPFAEVGQGKAHSVNTTAAKIPVDSSVSVDEKVTSSSVPTTPTTPTTPITSPKILSPVKMTVSPASKKPASPRASPKAANPKILSPSKRKITSSPKPSPSFTVKNIMSPPLQVKSPPFTPTSTEKQSSPPLVLSPKQIKSPIVPPVEESIPATPPKTKLIKPPEEIENPVPVLPALTIKPPKIEPKAPVETEVVKKPAKKQKKQKPKVKEEKAKENPEPIKISIAPIIAPTPPVVTSAVPTVKVAALPPPPPVSPRSSSWTHEEDSPTELTIDLSSKPKSSKKKKKKDSEGKTKKKDKASKSKHNKPDPEQAQAPIPKLKFKLDPVGGDRHSPALERTVKTETLYNTEVPGTSDSIYYCPLCSLPDDGSPMIGCDSCDEWFHWPCAGITSDPGEAEWYCTKCQSKKVKKKKKKKDKDKNKSRQPHM